MRRLVAAITRRSSKSDAGNTTDSTQDLQHPKSSFFRSLSRKVSTRPVNEDADSAADPRSKRHPIPPVNTLTTQPNQAPSSSSSSSGGPHTPDDDASSFLRTVLHKGRNEPWFPPSPQAVDNPSVPPHSASQASHPPPSFLALPVLPPLRLSQDDTEDDDSDLESSESEPSQLQPPPIPRPSLLHSHPLQLLSPVAYFHALTTSALQPPFSPPPLLDLPNLPLFPRSSNPTRSLVHNESLLSSMFKQRLSRRTLPPVSPDAQIALSPLGPHKPAPHPRPSLFLDDTALKDYSTVNVPSQGLKLWLNRPCFEDRLDVFLPDDPTGFVIQMPVSASTLGVAALEFTEPLELLAGLYDPQEDVPQIPVASPTLISPLSLSPSVSQPSPSLSPPSPQPQSTSPPISRPQSYKTAAPSPLRMETSSRPAPTRSILTSSSSLASPPPTSPPTIILSSTSPELRSRPLSQPPASKPGVHFAEEDKEDQIPLGYVLRIKQKREQKARFLQAERQRRVHEEERRKHEEERRRQEEEKKKWDGERAAWDKERRAMEEERKKRAYVEELAATRSRREGQRFGSVPSKHGLGPDGSLMMWEGDRERDRERRGRDARHSYSRPTYDGGSTSPRRQGSDSQVGLVASGSRNQSPGSSRPPSIGGSGSISGSVRGSSQPASIYSTPPSSTPDINARERRESKASRRTSNISDGSQRPLTGFEQAAFMNAYPWNMSTHSIPQFPVMPVLPVMPYMMDMPLLPPNPPFMLQQFGRPPSQNRSHTSSPSPGHHRLPTSQSLERVNQQGSSPVRHERRASGDASQSRRDRQAAEVRSQSHDRQSINSGTSRHSARTQPAPSRPPPTSMKSSPTHGSRSGSSRTSMMSPTSMQQQPQQQQQQQQYHHQQQPGSPLAPVPVMTSSWSQPAFQNLSRPGMPGSSRRQTMPS